MEKIKDVANQFNLELAQASTKGSVGVLGSFAAMTLNDWAGLFVALLTGVYMIFQIEYAWRKRKDYLRKQKDEKKA